MSKHKIVNGNSLSTILEFSNANSFVLDQLIAEFKMVL
jgi:hypothetical protein